MGDQMAGTGTLEPVLPDGLDQLPPREVLFAVKTTTVNIVDVCRSA